MHYKRLTRSVLCTLGQVARSIESLLSYRKLCPVHRGISAMSGIAPQSDIRILFISAELCFALSRVSCYPTRLVNIARNLK
jgi:hypothetical protein